MGILGLSKLIADVAPEAIKERELKHYFGNMVYLFILVMVIVYLAFNFMFLTITYDPRIFLHISDKIV